jgi:hypothetical protein
MLMYSKNRFFRVCGFCYDLASNSDISLGISCCDGCNMPMVAQPLFELSELRKMDHILVAVRKKINTMANVCCLHNGVATSGILQLLQHDMPRGIA